MSLRQSIELFHLVFLRALSAKGEDEALVALKGGSNLFDVAYLSAGRSRLFTALPELELPRGFRRAELQRWIGKISSERSRTITTRKLAAFLSSTRSGD